AGAADHDVDLGDAQVLGLAGRVGRRELGRVGGALLRALVADRTGGRPRDGVAVDVGDRDDGVVVRSVDERLALGEATSDALLGGLGWLSHLSVPHFFGAFFLPATVRRGPLRVRAFVFVD